MAKVRSVALTTTDNPFDPFDQWDEWFKYDLQLGYNCCGILAKHVPFYAAELPDAMLTQFVESAVDEIIEKYPLFPFKKVVRDIEEPNAYADMNVLELLDKFKS